MAMDRTAELDRDLRPEAPRMKHLVVTITYIVEPNHVNMDEVLDKLRETGAAGVTDISVQDLTNEEMHDLVKDF